MVAGGGNLAPLMVLVVCGSVFLLMLAVLTNVVTGRCGE